MLIGHKIKELRDSRGWSQDKLAAMLDMNRANVSNYERNYSVPSLGALVKIADTFNVSTDYILGRESLCNTSIPTEST